MKIKNVTVFDPSGGMHKKPGDISIVGGKIVNSSADDAVIDGTELTAMPGAIEIHTHIFGASGFARNHNSFWRNLFSLRSLTSRYLSQGITFFVEAGLTRPQIDQAVLEKLPIDFSLMQLDSNEPLHENALTIKYVGESGVERFLKSKNHTDTIPPHIHLPHLAKPGNIKTFENFLEKADGRNCHLAHLAYYIFSEKDGKPVPMAKKAVKLLEKNKNVSFDLGPVGFGKTFSLTAYAELAERISKSNKKELRKLENSPYMAVEYNFLKECYIDATFWLAGMELLLELKDISNASLSIDFPSGGGIESYPNIIACLISKEARDKFASKLNKEALKNSRLPSLTREFSLDEIAQITRSSPANACGLKKRGNLSEGSVADIVLYPIPKGDIGSISSSKLEALFRKPKFVIKDGRIVYKNGNRA